MTINKKIFFFLSIIVFFNINLFAKTILGISYAKNYQDAKKEALGDLANNISVEVKTDSSLVTNLKEDSLSKEYKKSISLSSNLPILGISFEKDGDRYIASISTKNSLRLYVNKLITLKESIDKGFLKLKDTKDDDMKFNILNRLLNEIESFNKHKLVAISLKGENLPGLRQNKSEILGQLHSIKNKVSSIKLASKLLTRGINKKNIYVSGFRVSGSSEITQFSKVLKNEIIPRVDYVNIPAEAEYYLKGSYEILKDSIFVTLSLYDLNNRSILTNTVLLDSIAYSHVKYKPSSITFDKALKTEFIKSGELNVKIGFKGYDREDGIDLYKDDRVDIVVKTNKPICYFLMGHVLHRDSKFSYLLPVGSGESPFINKITGEDVNRLLTVVEDIPISEPFGSESLQIFASTLGDKGRCSLKVPPCRDNEDGYCVVSSKPLEAVIKTRGLNMSKKSKKTQKYESSISWTSFEKR